MYTKSVRDPVVHVEGLNNTEDIYVFAFAQQKMNRAYTTLIYGIKLSLSRL